MSDQQANVAALEREAAELRSQMAALAADRAKIEETMARTRQRLSRVHYEMARLYEAGDVAPPPMPAVRPSAPQEPRKKRPYGNAKAAVQVVEAILRDAGKPMHTAPLLDELRLRGVVVDEPAPLSRLSNWLAKARDVVKNDRATGWHLKEWPGPPRSPAETAAPLLVQADSVQSTDAPVLDAADDRAEEGGQSAAEPATDAKVDRGFIKGLDPLRHRQRTLEGLAARKARGERLGREPTISQETWADLERRVEQGASIRAAALAIGISPSSAQRWFAGYYRKAPSTSPDDETED